LTLTHPPSLPGLTRQSILLSETFFLMDARVKPAHDESRTVAGEKYPCTASARPVLRTLMRKPLTRRTAHGA